MHASLLPVSSRALSLVVLLATASSALAQGLYWESESTGRPAASPLGPPSDQPRLSKTYAMPKKLRREDADTTMIIRLDKEVFYMLRPKDKTYTEMTFADMEKSMKGLSEQLDGKSAEMKKAMEEMEKQLKDLPPERRAAIEKQLKSNPLFKGGEAKDGKEVKLDVVKTDEQRAIAGRACLKYVAKEDGKDVVTAWTTTAIPEFVSLRQDWVAVQKRMAAMNPMLGKSKAQAFERIEGFPMETEMSGVKTVVTKVEPRSTPDSEFEVPGGYTRTKSPFEGPGIQERLKGLEKKKVVPGGAPKGSEPRG